MKDKQLTVTFALFCYASNGGWSSMLPELADWLRETHLKTIGDKRIDKVHHVKYSDTPVTLCRNLAVKEARAAGVDVLLMLDNDNAPDIEPDGQPFWDTSFDFLWNHFDKGPVLVMAPYCSGPPYECPMIFEWHDFQTGEKNDAFKLHMINRTDAARRAGIQPVAAGPTGVSMWDMRLFDLIPKPYFAYEWTDEDCSEKASTEDVYTTRNVSLAGISKLGYNPVFMNCDCWAGHSKPKMVGKPQHFTADRVHESLRKAVLDGYGALDRKVVVAAPPNGRPLFKCNEATARAQIIRERLEHASNGRG